MKNMKALLMGSAAFACIGVASESAHAQSYAFGAGATFPQIVYRQLMDCLYNQAQGSTGKPGPLALNAACNGANGSGFGGEILYAPTGSGNGKAVLLANNPSTIGTPGNSVPYTDSTIGVTSTTQYDGVQFVGSDDIINSTDTANWAAGGSSSAQSKFGNYIQLPAVIGAVGIGFNGKDGNGGNLNIIPATPTGGSSGLNLTRQALCGIVSGHITKWDNSLLTAINGGTLGTGQITFVHRTDGSGTTFLMSNALATQCQFVYGPNNETDTTTVSYALPWTDHSSACPPTAIPVAHGANQLNWPDQFPTDQCGTAVTYPTGSKFANASGTGNLVAMVSTTNGAIGYASQDFWLPVKVGGLPAANIQSQWDITAGTGAFQPPTATGAQTAMASAVPQFTSSTIVNPLTWSLQGVQPNPVVPGAYPLSGFTWLEMYQCYQTHSNGNNAYIWFKTFLDYLYGSAAQPVLASNGFAQVPTVWLNQIYTLFNDSVNKPNGSGCSGKVGAY